MRYNIAVIKREIIQVPAEGNKLRLEDFLLGIYQDVSKMYIRETVKNGGCEVNGFDVNIGTRLRENDLIEIDIDRTRGTAMRRENIPLNILYEDDHIIVVNKPAGMLMHPSHRENSGTLINGLAFYLNQKSEGVGERESKVVDETGNGEEDIISLSATHQLRYSATSEPGRVTATFHRPFSDPVRPGLPHRLDKDTSGLIVATKTAAAHRRLSALFMAKKVVKRYAALVVGAVAPDEGIIEAPIGRYAELKHWSVKDDGRPATTNYWVRERFADRTLLELEPVTGRTNQLRIHCELLGHPIIGDVKRGGGEFARLCLHAERLAFRHPMTGAELSFGSPVSAELFYPIA